MPRAAKVFRARIGFHDTVVAVPSKAAALKAWGVRQDLFAEGLAERTEEPDVVRAALDHPGVVLRRPAGSTADFSLDPAPPEAPEPARKAARPRPDRRPLDKAEKALRELEAAQGAQQRRLDDEQAALDQRKAAADADFRRRLADAEAALEKARADYAAAGRRP